MLAVITDPEPNAPIPNGVISPGALNSPVCWPQGGATSAPRETGETSTSTKNVVPCRYPWDVPFGIIVGTGTGTVSVRSTGELELQYGYDTSTAQLYGKPEIGTRIYYDGTVGQYVCANAVGAYGNSAARFPGAATIGYVTCVDGTLVRIKIDPQPPTAQYVMVVDTATSDTLIRGDVVVISTATNTVAKWTTGTEYCSGVYTGYAYLRTSGGGYNRIICTSGPTWIYPTYAQLYAIKSATNLVNYSPHNARIGADMAIRIVSATGTTQTIPTLGFLHWDKWYTGTSTNRQSVMVYVDPDPKSPGINPTPKSEPITVKYMDGI